MVAQIESTVAAAAAPDSRAIRVYNNGVRNGFDFLKRTSRLDDLMAKAVALPEGRGYLVPVCDLYDGDDILIAQFAAWREANALAFPSRFPVNHAGTASWLRAKVLDVDDRLLFLIVDRCGHLVGHMGFANTINDAMTLEVDNVVRGVAGAEPGLMGEALAAMVDWAEEMFRPRSVFLRVLSDNSHAINFYTRLGFQADGLIPLRRRREGAGEFLHEVENGDVAPPDAHFLRMSYAPERAIDEAPALISTAGPSISAREASYALDAAKHGWNRQWSGYLTRLEESACEYLGVKHALATSSGTGALHLAMAALGIGPGDEVIVPDLTWVASANAVVYAGGTPVFVDVDPDTWCMDPVAFKAAITSRTKAVVPVHLYGHPADMDRIVAIARKHSLFIVEDAAPAVGAECRGRKVGTYGDFAAFSFQGAKLVVSGEGGLLVTSDENLFARAQSLWDQGRDPHRTFWINKTGLKYKMANVQAAIGLGQMERVDELIEAKRLIASWYAEGLAGVPHIRLFEEADWARGIAWMSSLILEESAPLSREEFRTALKDRNIDTRPVFPAISQYPIWKRPQEPCPVARRVGDRGVNLPSGVCLKREQVDYVSRCIREMFAA
jgi:perosamine synthetase